MAISAIPAFTATPATFATRGAQSAGSAQPAAGADFAGSLLGMIDKADSAVKSADAAGQAAATGDLRNVHDYMIASAEASTTLEMTVAVKNEAVRAFQSVMNTPV